MNLKSSCIAVIKHLRLGCCLPWLRVLEAGKFKSKCLHPAVYIKGFPAGLQYSRETEKINKCMCQGDAGKGV